MGFLTKKKTIVDMNFIELFTPDAAYRQAKFETYFTTDSMKDFNETMFRWKKDHRGRYRERYLERAGLEPTSNATRLKIDRALLLDYLITKYSTANKIISNNFLIPSLSYVSRFYLQENGYNWSNYTDTLIVGSEEYKLEDIDYADPEDDTQIIIYFKNKNDSEDIYEIPFINQFHAITCLNARYETSDSATEWYIYIEDKTTVPLSLYTIDDLTMTAIIPIKEDNVMHDDTLWTKRMMNRLGIGGEELSGQIEEETNIDNAYIFTGLKFNSENQAVAKALYQTFKYMSEATLEEPEPDEFGFYPTVEDNVNFTMSKMELGYDFDMTIETKTGVALRTYSELDADAEVQYVTEPLEIGKYYSVLNENLNENTEISFEQLESGWTNIIFKVLDRETDLKKASVLKIRYQISPNTYKEMTISNYVNTFTISGYDFTAYLDSDEENGRLIIPLDVLNNLKFKEWIQVHDRSFTMLAYSHQVVKIYWYQQSWFSWVIKIGLAIFTGGLSLTWDFVLDLIIAYAITWGIGEILKMIDSQILMVLAAFALTALGASFAGDFDIGDFTVENYLPLATKSIQTASNIYQQQIMSEIAKIEEKTKEEERRDELLDAELNSQGFVVTKAIMDAHFSFNSIQGPDVWVSQQLGFGLYNFDQFYEITNQLDVRVDVVSG